MLLSESELRSALEPLLDRLLIERLRYFQLQLEPRLQTLIEAALQPRAASELGDGLDQLLRTDDPNQAFEILFEQSLALVGPARALLVTNRGETAVWKSHELNLPARFPAAQQSATLRSPRGRAHGLHPILVRGAAVGAFYWEAAAELEAAAQARLQLLLKITGLLLLAQAFPAPKPAPALTAATSPTNEATPPTPPRSVPLEPAERFAHLLIEDLDLYLERDQAQELAEARRRGDASVRFRPELDRCRRAFLERYPTIGATVFEEAAKRLGA